MKIQLADRIECPECRGCTLPRVNCERCGGEGTVPDELDLEDLTEEIAERLMHAYTKKRQGLEEIEDKLTAMVDARCRQLEESYRQLREEIRCLSFPRGE